MSNKRNCGPDRRGPTKFNKQYIKEQANRRSNTREGKTYLGWLL